MSVQHRQTSIRALHEPDGLTQVQLAVAELGQVVEENNTNNQLAIAELAEAMLGGDTGG